MARCFAPRARFSAAQHSPCLSARAALKREPRASGAAAPRLACALCCAAGKRASSCRAFSRLSRHSDALSSSFPLALALSLRVALRSRCPRRSCPSARPCPPSPTTCACPSRRTSTTASTSRPARSRTASPRRSTRASSARATTRRRARSRMPARPAAACCRLPFLQTPGALVASSSLCKLADAARLPPLSQQVRSKLLAEKYGWDKDVAKKIWCFGPDTTGAPPRAARTAPPTSPFSPRARFAVAMQCRNSSLTRLFAPPSSSPRQART